MRALDDEVGDERYAKMGKYFPQEREAIIRDAIQRM